MWHNLPLRFRLISSVLFGLSSHKLWCCIVNHLTCMWVASCVKNRIVSCFGGWLSGGECSCLLAITGVVCVNFRPRLFPLTHHEHVLGSVEFLTVWHDRRFIVCVRKEPDIISNLSSNRIHCLAWIQFLNSFFTTSQKFGNLNIFVFCGLKKVLTPVLFYKINLI